jgi:hypothetical protein
MVAGFMAVWLSGFVFLFCCNTAEAAGNTVEFCPMAAMSHHCDKARTQDNGSDAIGAAEELCVNCSLLPVIFDKARKVEAPQKQIVAPAEIAVVRSPVFRIATSSPQSARFVPRLLDKSRIFVSIQVFRI